MHTLEGYSTCPVCLCVCPAGANLQTGSSRHLTKSTSGLSGTFFTKTKGILSKTASLVRLKCYKLIGTKPARVCHFVHVAMFRVALNFMSVKLVQ